MKTVGQLFIVWALLFLLLALTVAASFVATAPLGTVVSLGVALAKAALIYWFFMHLREESGLVRLFSLGAIAWLLLIFVLTTADYLTRG